MATLDQYYGTGRRKAAIARVYLREGNGTIRINKREFDEYFPQATLRLMIRRPLEVTENGDKFDIVANIIGGGLTGQAGALRLGIARALLQFDADLRPKLKGEGLLTRDARVVERKKYGQKGARARFQFSKR
ncbi:MAG: 30S ribosomal protein S9 [Acidobacteriota bacterium]|nr:MAG: 30S ribosomal protein S9 [Acidobacteriota bacterium]